MLQKLRDKIAGTDALIRAMRGFDPEEFVEVFAQSNVLFLQLPPGCENGLDPNLPQEELLAHVTTAAKDLSEREQFMPFCRVQGKRKSLLLFTQQDLMKEFVQAYVRDVKRIMPFQCLGMEGRIAVRLFDGVDSVVFNAGTKHEHELATEDVEVLRILLSPAIPDHPRQE